MNFFGWKNYVLGLRFEPFSKLEMIFWAGINFLGWN